jgi:peptide/nickel transport system ATP-binding protein
MSMQPSASRADGARLSVRKLSTSFMTDQGRVQSVADVSFDIAAGGTLALVGESGSGKSVTSLSLVGLHAKGSQAQVGGEAWFVCRDGRRVDLLKLSEGEHRRLRGNELAMIFQEPMTSLNPVLTVGEQIAESARLHLGMDRKPGDAARKRRGCLTSSKFRRPNAGCVNIRTSFRAACASA